MSRRRRSKMNDQPTTTSTVKSGHTLNDIPVDLIVEASKSHSMVRIGVRRRDGKGRWSYITSNVPMETMALLDLPAWLNERCGGGEYRIEVKGEDDPSLMPVPAFLVPLEGPPKKYQNPGEVPVNSDRGSDGNGSDSVMSRMAEKSRIEARSDVQNERRLREESERRHKAEMDRMKAELDRQREENREREERAREAAHRAEIQGLRDLISQGQQRPQTNIMELMSALATALVPIGTAMITASSNRRAAEMQQQQTMITSQNQMLATILSQKPSESELTKLLPTLIPLAKTFMEMRDPSKQAEMWSVMGDQMLTQAQLAGDMIRAIAEQQPDQPAWMPMATELFAGVERYAKYIYQAQHGGGGEPPTSMQSAGPQLVPGAPDGAVNAQPNGSMPPQKPASAPPENASLPEKVGHVLNQLPPCFQNQEWGEIVYFMIAGDTANIGGIAHAIVDLLVKLQEANAVPQELYPVYEDPTQIGPRFIFLIPVKSADYRDKVMKATLAALRQAHGDTSNGSGNVQYEEEEEEEQQPTRVM